MRKLTELLENLFSVIYVNIALSIRRHSREECLAKVRESQVEEEGREWEILEEERDILVERQRECSGEVEKEALYISPEISV